MISTAHNRRTNNPAALAIGGTTREDDFAAFDELPPPVRVAVGQQVTKLNSASILAYYRSIARQAHERGGSPVDAEIWTLRKLVQVEAAEMDAFAAQHRERYGYALPQQAAEVSVQRYVGSGRARRRRLRPAPEIRGMEVREVA